MASIQKLKDDYDKAVEKEQELSSLLLVNLEKYKAAKAKGDEMAIAKHTKIAGDLGKKKAKATKDASAAYKAYENRITGLHLDAELELTEFRQYIRNVIFEQLKKKKLNESDIDMDKVFMKGKDQDEYRDEERVEKDVEKALKDLEKNIKVSDLKSKNQNEAALELTLGGIALSLPQIIKIIGKFVNLLSKIPGLKFLSGDKIIDLGNKMHNKIIGAITFATQKMGVTDKTKAEQFANIIFHVILAILLVAGGAAAVKYASKGNVVGATMKGALDAVKAGEIRSFIVKSVETLT